ncbi:hypothetical protein JHK86_012602 [Glycine max]|nr:hypothetical protein JHK86_012602 [Glycine max]
MSYWVFDLLDFAKYIANLKCGKSCRLRWINYLRPDLKRGAFSQQEENSIVELHAVLGNNFNFGFSLDISMETVGLARLARMSEV